MSWLGDDSALSDTGGVERAVASGLRTTVTSIERIREGRRNQVFRLDTADGRQLVARVANADSSRFDAEAWAIEQGLAAGLPVPRVWRLEPVTDSAGHAQVVCIQERLPGVSIRSVALDGMPIELLRDLSAQAGELLARLHKVTTKGFGQIDRRGRAASSSWKELMRWALTSAPKAADLPAGYDVDPDLVEAARALGLAEVEALPDIPPGLVHGDFTPVHVLAQDGRVTGFVDLELCFSGDGGYDFAYWDYWESGIVEVDWLLEGYGGDRPTHLRRRRLARLSMCLAYLALAGQVPPEDGLWLSLRRHLEEDLAEHTVE